jgi:Short C-terminal domain
MFGRRRPLLRAAAVAGGSYMAGKHVAQRRADQQYADAEQDQRISDLEQQGAAPPAPPAAARQGPSMGDQLNQLADLHRQGVLSDDEFAAAKAKLLGT